MTAKPNDWNIVIPGAWNTAILTPEGVAHRLFHLESGTPLEIQVPLDRRAPLLVGHGGIVVATSSSRLVVTPTSADSAGLKKASEIAARALSSLPETPFAACGVNIRFALTPPPPEISDLTRCLLDDRLSDAQLQRIEVKSARAVSWDDGVLNVDLSYGDQRGTLLFNFHCPSTDRVHLEAWLERTDAMVQQATELLSKVFQIKEGEDE